MTKYHIKKDGAPGVCNAKINCPLGGPDEHFNSIQEAQEFADKKNSEAMFNVSVYEDRGTSAVIKQNDNELHYEDNSGNKLDIINNPDGTKTVSYSDDFDSYKFIADDRKFDEAKVDKIENLIENFNDHGYDVNYINDLDAMKSAMGDDWDKFSEKFPEVNTPEFKTSLENEATSFRVNTYKSDGANYSDTVEISVSGAEYLSDNDSKMLYQINTNSLFQGKKEMESGPSSDYSGMAFDSGYFVIYEPVR